MSKPYSRFGVVGEVNLVGLLDGGELLDELIVLGQRLEALEQFQIGDPLVGAQTLGDEVGQARVGELDEATRGHAVGHVGELVRVDVGEVLQGNVLQQLGVQLSHAIDVGATVGGQVSHAHGVASVDGHVLMVSAATPLALSSASNCALIFSIISR